MSEPQCMQYFPTFLRIFPFYEFQQRIQWIRFAVGKFLKFTFNVTEVYHQNYNDYNFVMHAFNLDVFSVLGKLRS